MSSCVQLKLIDILHVILHTKQQLQVRPFISRFILKENCFYLIVSCYNVSITHCLDACWLSLWSNSKKTSLRSTFSHSIRSSSVAEREGVCVVLYITFACLHHSKTKDVGLLQTLESNYLVKQFSACGGHLWQLEIRLLHCHLISMR